MNAQPTAVPAEGDAKPMLDDATRAFVRRALNAGLVELDELKKVVTSLMTESDHFTPDRLASGLTGAGVLTKWQASKLLSGRSKGFYLGSYRLLRPIGKGGMGVVYLGEHHVMKRMMALKILPPEATDNPKRLQRFKEEARACAQLDHPNIVQAYDCDAAGERFYIVMEYVDGIDLHHAVSRDGVMSPSEAIDLISQAASGLAHAHERGIIHRDIKPANLLLRTDGVLKVSDLGLARIGMSGVGDTESNRYMGTADFMAPEQAINSQNVDARADIYSLGCTLYFLLTGRPPYSGDSVKQRLAKHQTAEIPDPRQHNANCPAVLFELMSRMMAKRPENRPKSMQELVSRLKRIGGDSVGAAQRHQKRVEPASDTDIDESVYQATIEDTSLSSDGEVEIVEVAQSGDLGEFDFSDLPDQTPVSSDEAVAYRGTSAANVTAPSQAKPQPASSGGSAMDRNQTLLLGIGLAIAFMALLGVVGMAIYSISKPLPEPNQPIKALEKGKDGSVIIIERPGG